MSTFMFKTRGNTNPQGKPRVYFTCHPEDFAKTFEKVYNDILSVSDCAIYYTENMTESITEHDRDFGLKRMNLFVVPITQNLLLNDSRAINVDVAFARENDIPVLPVMFDSGLLAVYSRNELLGELQYIDPFSSDPTELGYEEKLRRFIKSVLINDDLAKRIRKEFDAYIFLSYRKKDRYLANQLMQIIHNKPECRDIAIWFDEYLTPSQSFRENIYKMLAESKIFTLLVTPNILEEPDGKPNFVMGEEYPAAKHKGMVIVPVEMQETDKGLLVNKFADIPECVDPHIDDLFREKLKQALEQIVIKSNDNIPEHNYLIGLAYRDGIDVEVNRKRGLELIEMAAEAGLPEAAKELVTMYYYGYCVKKNNGLAQYWQKKRIEILRNQHRVAPSANTCLNLIDAFRFYTEIARNGKNVQNNIDEMISCCVVALELCDQVDCTNDSETSHLIETKLNTLRSLAILQEYKQSFDDALVTYEKALALRKRILKLDEKAGLEKTQVLNKWRVAQIYHDMGILFERKGAYVEAVERLEDALAIYEEIAKTTVAFIPNTIGVHNAIASNATCIDINKAIRHNQIALKLSKALYEANPENFVLLYARTVYSKAVILSKIGFREQERIDAVYAEVKDLLKPFVEGPSSDALPIIAGTYQKLCNRHLIKGNQAEQNEQFDVALQNYVEAVQEMEVLETIGMEIDKLDIADLYDRIALCYEMLQNYEEAHKNYAQAALLASNEAKVSNRLDAFTAAITYTQKLASFCDDFGTPEEAKIHYGFCSLLEEERDNVLFGSTTSLGASEQLRYPKSLKASEERGANPSANDKESNSEISQNLESLFDEIFGVSEEDEAKNIESQFNELFGFNEEDGDDLDDLSYITLTDENGQNVRFKFADLIKYQGNEYIVLIPLTDNEVIILLADPQVGDAVDYLPVEDELLLGTLFELFRERNKHKYNFTD